MAALAAGLAAALGSMSENVVCCCLRGGAAEGRPQICCKSGLSSAAAWPSTMLPGSLTSQYCGGLLLVTLAGEWRWWEIDASASFVTEVDGLRVMTNAGHYFMRRVPEALVSVLEIGSTSPGAGIPPMLLCCAVCLLTPAS